MDYSNSMQLFHLKADMIKNVTYEIVLEHTKAAAVLPDFILTPKHLIQKVKVEIVFESSDESHAGHGQFIRFIVISISQFDQGMFFHVYVILSHQRIHSLNFADFQCIMHILELVGVHLKHFSKVAVAKLLDCLKHLDVQRLVLGMFQYEILRIYFAYQLMLGPVLFLALN